MKNLLTVTLLLLSVAAFSQTKKNEKAVIKTAIYCDHCKECETCGKHFQTNLYAIKGLKMFDIDQKANTITVYYDGRKTNIDDIRTAISNLGYDADEVKANAAAYEKLDGCCRKL